MKNRTKLLVVAMILMMVLTACGTKEQSKTFVHNDKGITQEMTYTYEDDLIKRLDMKTEMPFTAMLIESKEDAEKTVEILKSTEPHSEGITFNYEITDDRIIVTGTADYDKIDVNELAARLGIEASEEDVRSMAKVEEALLKLGYQLK